MKLCGQSHILPLCRLPARQAVLRSRNKPEAACLISVMRHLDFLVALLESLFAGTLTALQKVFCRVFALGKTDCTAWQ